MFIYLLLSKITLLTGHQTYKQLLSPFFVILIIFDLYSTIVFQIYFIIICSLLSLYLYYDMGGPKKCRNIYKFNKYKNNKYNTTIDLLISSNKCQKMYIYFLSMFSKFLFNVTLSFVHFVV